jgi:GNAT superfamily N-acetyltransferase
VRRAGRPDRRRRLVPHPEGAPAETIKLFQFHVDPAHRGIGTGPHTACVEEWRADRRTTAVLDVYADHQRARAFRAARGWTPGPDHPAAPDDHHLALRLQVRP